eukprot:jgi/Ulvmu1/10942/UM007_0121.1
MPDQSAGTFATLRTKLIQTFHSDTAAAGKLSVYIEGIRSHLDLGYASLSLVSKALWLQSSIVSTKADAAPPLPSAPEPMDEYSIARQLQEMSLEDPQALLTEYGGDDDLPSDLGALSKSLGLAHFMVQSVCSSEGRLLGFMVFGHPDRTPFASTEGWAALSETLAAIMCATVTASRIPQIMALAEHARLARTQADLIVVLSAFVPSILFGEWSFAVQSFVTMLQPSQKGMLLYKYRQQPAKGLQEAKLRDMRRAALSRSLHNIRRVASIPSVMSRSIVNGKMSATMPLGEDAGPSRPEMTPAEIAAHASLSAGATVMQQHVRLANTFMHSALTSACSVFVDDISHHLVDTPDVHSELLLMLNGVPPRRLALFPIYGRDGAIVGGLYLVSAMPVRFSSMQGDVETLLAICSQTLVSIMQDGAQPRSQRQGVPLELSRTPLAQKLSKPTSIMQLCNDADSMHALQVLFAGIIAKQDMSSVTSQACQPEHVRLESLIGMGTFGVVYKGRIDLLNTVVAVKVMAFQSSMEDVRMRRIAMELATLSRSKHHNVVDIIAYFPDCVSLLNNNDIDGPCFRVTTAADVATPDKSRTLQRCCVIVMEYCAYGTLLSALQMDIFKFADGSPDVSSVCYVLIEIASALAHIHAIGIIHCDLKPQNVLLKVDDCDPRGFVTKLADFGLARVVSGDLPLLHGDSAGTPSHLAPEIVKTKDGDSIKTPKADIFAFGVLMWEMYMSQQAFASFDQNDVLLLVIQGRRLPFPPGADPAYVSLCQRCWAADMDKRPSLRVVQEELRAITRAHVAYARAAALANPTADAAPMQPQWPGGAEATPAPAAGAPPAPAPEATMQSCPNVPAPTRPPAEPAEVPERLSGLQSVALTTRLAEAAEKLTLEPQPLPAPQ